MAPDTNHAAVIEDDDPRRLTDGAHALGDDQKRKFLKFVTGSDRVPIRGLSAIKLVVSRAGGDSNRLPSAHTCFDHLLLPDYADLATLKVTHVPKHGTNRSLCRMCCRPSSSWRWIMLKVSELGSVIFTVACFL